METLLGPGVPFRGINTSNDASFIGPGFWQKATNCRASSSCVEVRGGQSVSKAIGALPAGTFKGAIETNDGTFLAWRVTSTTKINIYKWSGSAWVAIDDSATTALTNFSDASNSKQITFTVVRDAMLSTSAPFNLPGQRYLVIQSGASGDYPRVCKADAAAAAGLLKIHAPIGYGGISQYHARVTYSQYLKIIKEDSGRTPATLTVTESDATKLDGTITNAGTSQQYVTITIKTATPIYDKTVTLTFTSGSVPGGEINFSTVKELHVLFGGTNSDIWTQFLIEASDSSGVSWVTLFDPTDTSYPSPVILPAGDVYLAGFKLKTIASATYTKIRLTFKGTDQTSQSTLDIYGIFGSCGSIPGGTEFSVGYMDSASRAEGPAVVCAADGEPAARNFGAPTLATTNYAELSIPISPALGYEYQIFDGSYNSTGTPDYKNIYAKLPEGSEFLYVTSSSSLSSATVVTSYIPYLLPAPTGLHVPIPVASVMASIGARLWCGNVRQPYTAASTSDSWFSSLDTPFRFKSILEFTNGVPDIKGPATVTMQGEVVQAIIPIAGGAIGSEGCFIFTDQNIYQAGGSDSFQLTRPGRRASFGTNAPGSIAIYANQIIFMDSERQVRFLDASLTPISRDFVEDKLLGIPGTYIGNVSAGIWHEKYYLAYTPSGGTTNTAVLVFDMRRGMWCDDTVSSPIAKFVPFNVSGERQNLVFLTDGREVQYDKAGSDELGSDIAVTLKSREISNGLWLPVVIKQIGVIADRKTGKSLTCKRYTKVNPTTPTSSTLDIDDNGNREYGSTDVLTWRTDADSPATIVDVAASIELTGTLPTGTRFYSINAEVSAIDAGGADRI